MLCVLLELTHRLWFVKEYLTLRRHYGTRRDDVPPPTSLINERNAENLDEAMTDWELYDVEDDFCEDDDNFLPCNRDYVIDDDIRDAPGDFNLQLCALPDPK